MCVCGQVKLLLAHIQDVVTFEGGVVTPERGDEVSEQRHEDEAEVCVQTFTWLLLTPAQVQSQGLREGRRDADETLSFLFTQKTQNQRSDWTVFFLSDVK